MTSQFRYPGAKPFSTQEQPIFFGREKDIENFYRLINIEPLVVLYGKSGLGKSSLINAGIIPAILAAGKYTPWVFRFGAWSADKKETPLNTTRERLYERLPKTFLQKLAPKETSLWAYLKTQQIQAAGNKGNILIFDQFEELFTYPEQLILEFKQQLAEAVNLTIPQRISDVLEAGYRHKNPPLSPTEMDRLHQPYTVKVVFVVRSDRLSLLNNLTDYLPSILRTCYELGAMKREEAEEAILLPAYQRGEFVSAPFDFEDEAIEQILHYLTENGAKQIESFQLQILCQYIERRVIEQKIKKIAAGTIGDPDLIYKNYYDDQIARLGDAKTQLAARIFIEDGLIFEEEERRLSLYEGQIYKTYGIAPELLRQLVDSHLLRAEPSLRGGYTYELCHDTLVAPVLASKAKRKAEEARTAAEKNRQEQMQLLAEERRKRQRALMLAVAGFFLFAVAAVLGFFALQQSQKAENAKKEAVEAKNLAISQRDTLQQTLDALREAKAQITVATTQANEEAYQKNMAKGKGEMQNGNYIGAILAFRAALLYRPADPEAGRSIQQCEAKMGNTELYNRLMQEGDRMVSSQQFIPAINAYQKALKLNLNANSNTAAQNKMEETRLLMLRKLAELAQAATSYAGAGYCDAAKKSVEQAQALLPFLKQKNTREEMRKLEAVVVKCP